MLQVLLCSGCSGFFGTADHASAHVRARYESNSTPLSTWRARELTWPADLTIEKQQHEHLTLCHHHGRRPLLSDVQAGLSASVTRVSCH